MYNFDVITNENNVEHNPKWPYIPDHPQRMLIIGGSRSGKTNALLNLTEEEEEEDTDLLTAIEKIYLYAKDLNGPKYQLLIEKREDAGIKHLNNSKPFIEYSNTLDDVYNDIEEYNPKRGRKILIVFDDMIVDINTNNKFQAILKKLFHRCRKLNISLVSIPQSHVPVPKDFRLNSTHNIIMNIHNKRELQNIAINHSADIDYKDLKKIYREYTSGSYSFLTIDTTLHPIILCVLEKIF